MFEFVKNLVIFLFSLVVLIVVHELGHFATAKMFKVYVSEFSIGFGPLIYQKKGKETNFSIRGIPLGGYCAIVGEDMPELSPEEYKDLSDKDKELLDLYQKVPTERKLDGIAKWKRAIIMAAGVTLNLVLAVVLFFCCNLCREAIYMYHNNVEVSADSIAAKAGWENDDDIINAKYVVTFYDENNQSELLTREFTCSEDDSNLYRFFVSLSGEGLTKSSNDTVDIYLTTSENKEINFSLKTVVNQDQNNNVSFSWEKIGVTLLYETRPLTFSEIIDETFTMTGDGAVAIVKGLGMLFTKEGIQQVGGIVAIFEISQEVNAAGLASYFNLWGLISVNLAVVNLLPFPGLDGWHILVLIIEGISRKELPKKFKNIMSTIGMVLLFILMILLVFKDLFF